MRVIVASLAFSSFITGMGALTGRAFAQDGPPAPAPPPCAPGAATFDFEGNLQGAWADNVMALSLRNPVLDPTRALCGRSSVRMDVVFNSEGDVTPTHQRPYEVGELMVKVGGPGGVRDFTGMTVEAGVTFDGPSDVYPRARIFLVSDARWVPGDASLLAPGQWTVLRHAFGELNPSGEGESLRVNHTFKIVVFVECPGCRAWQGTMNVDAIRWYPTAGALTAASDPAPEPPPVAPPPAVAAPVTIAAPASPPQAGPAAGTTRAMGAVFAGTTVPIKGLNYNTGIGVRVGVNLGSVYLGGALAVHQGDDKHIAYGSAPALGIPAGRQDYSSTPVLIAADAGYRLRIPIGRLATVLMPYASVGVMVVPMSSSGVYGDSTIAPAFFTWGGGLSYSVPLGEHYAIGLHSRTYTVGAADFTFGDLSKNTYEHGFSTSIFYSAFYSELAYVW